jgi:hypothetical protein
MGDRWAGAWSRPVNESPYVWLPLSFPSSTSLSMSWYASINIDTATGSVTGVPFSADPAAMYELVNRKSHKLLNVKDGSTSTGTDTEQRTDTDVASEQWRLISVGGGYYKIANRLSGLILGPTGGVGDDGAPIEQWTDGGWTSQHWQLVDAGGGFYKLRNRATGKLIDVSGGSLSDGANVIQWTDNGGRNQQWQIVVTN